MKAPLKPRALAKRIDPAEAVRLATEAAPHHPPAVAALPAPQRPAGPVEAARATQVATKALTVKLDAGLYDRLLDLAHARYRQSGKRATHQELMVEGLLLLLEREGQ